MLGSVEEELVKDDMCEQVEGWEMKLGLEYFDDTSGEPMDEALVQAACREELQSFKDIGVYEYVRREVAAQDQRG